MIEINQKPLGGVNTFFSLKIISTWNEVCNTRSVNCEQCGTCKSIFCDTRPLQTPSPRASRRQNVISVGRVRVPLINSIARTHMEAEEKASPSPLVELCHIRGRSFAIGRLHVINCGAFGALLVVITPARADTNSPRPAAARESCECPAAFAWLPQVRASGHGWILGELWEVFLGWNTH